jgi:hypothetical protein
MEDEGHQFKTCLFVGSTEASGWDTDLLLPHFTIVYVRTEPPQSGDLSSSLGFASDREFKSVQNQVDLVATFSTNGMLSVELAGQITALLVHTCAMNVVVMIAAAGYVNMYGGIQSLPIVEWLGRGF